jgi:cytochrome c-type biogenesis protein
MTENLNLAVAFIGGVLYFFSPCFLPLVPAYLIYITGLSLEELKNFRIMTIFHSLLFILGFTFVFTFLGLAAGLAGEVLFRYKDVLRVLGGLLVIFFGIYMMGLIRLPFLDMEHKITISSKPAGYLGTFFVGMVFAVGWTPCVGPILAGICLCASQAGTLRKGMMLLTAFSMGLALPLFLSALAVNYFLSLMKKIERYLGVIHIISGAFLILLGILMVTNFLQNISVWLIRLTEFKGI